MDIRSIIEKKRDGGSNSREELEWIALAAAKGEVPDYQLSAWLMAAYIHSLTDAETAWLTLGMAASGERMDLTGLPKPWVDKHSTGGVGDKTTLVLLPLLASCGVTMMKMSGRGLGITGGTIDKLESIPGFRTDLSVEELKDQAKRIGLAISGQTPNLAPADKVFYALRDATETVGSIPLIVSSILSKKIAGGADTIVIDVKCGSGAFMKTHHEAEALAQALKKTGEQADLDLHLAITDMTQPLGRMVGNALEVEEAAGVLTGQETGRFTDLCLDLAGLSLFASGKAETRQAGQELARTELLSGRALAKAQEWISAQGGDATVLTRPDRLPRTANRQVLQSPSAGFVGQIDAEAIGRAVVELGGGRHRKGEQIDFGVGIELNTEVGAQIGKGDPICTVHYNTEIDFDPIQGAFTISESEPHPQIPLFSVL